MGLPGSERRYIYKASAPTSKTEATLTRNTDIVGRASEGSLKFLQLSKFGFLRTISRIPRRQSASTLRQGHERQHPDAHTRS